MAEARTFADAVGKIISYSVIYVPTPEFAGEAPYGLAVIETSDGERLLARLPADDKDKLAVGAAVVYDHADQHGAVFRVQ
ncbi:MAG: OB-fold domain-containing protein [Nitrolancea sp.]